MKSFVLLTMKSKQVWMKSKLYGFDEIKSVYLSAAGDFTCNADFFHAVDLFRRKTDLVEKTANFVSKLTVFSGGERGIRTLGTVSGSHTFQACALDQLSHLSIFIIFNF